MKKFKVKSIYAASLWITLAVLVMSAVCMLLLGVKWYWACAVVLALSGLVLAVSQFIIRKYVIYRLKPVYQIVLSKNIRTSDLEREFAHGRSHEEKMGRELVGRVEKNRDEIKRLKDNEKYRKEFIGNVSHEIKTPIFNIQGYILTLLDGALEDRNINRKYLERAEKSIDRLINIVNDLDEISKLESGVLNLKFEDFDIVSWCREIVETLEMEAGRKNIRIRIDSQSASQAVVVRADKKYIGQVFINLIVNSIRYGVEGGTTTVAFIDMFDKVMVEVTDNGEGIAEEDLSRLFERFFRTDKSRSREQGGTGLGLSIVKHIIEAHSESISVRSELGVGSTFSFTLTKADV